MPHTPIRPLFVALACSLAAAAASADCIFPSWTYGSNTPLYAMRVAAADLNGDGRPDAVGNTLTQIAVSLTSVMGTLTPVTVVQTGEFTQSILAAELTGGGGVDLAFIDDTTSTLVILPGNGDGTFGAKITTSLVTDAFRVKAFDYDKDGKTDLLIAAPTSVVIYRNAGSGMFTQAATIEAVPLGEVAADIDGDGWMDVAVGGGTAGIVKLFFGKSDGTFEPVVVQPAFFNPLFIRAADMDSDGRLELVALSTPSSVSVIRNLTGRAFGDVLFYRVGLFSHAIEVGELNGDAHPDVLISGAYGTVAFFPGTGIGTLDVQWYGMPDYNSSAQLHDVALADFDGDGRRDALLAASNGGYVVPGAHLAIYRNRCGDSEVELLTQAPVISNGQSVALTVAVQQPEYTYEALYATGNVTLKEGDNVLETKALEYGSATFTVSPSTGTHTYKVSYGGDDQYEPNVSNELEQRVITGTTTTTLGLSATMVDYANALKLSANLTSTVAGTPTGVFTFLIDGEPALGHGVQPAPSGSITIWPTTFGSHTVSVRYSGDETHPPSTATRTFTVRNATPLISIAPSYVFAEQPVDLHFIVHHADPNAYNFGAKPSGTLMVKEGTTVVASGPIDSYYNELKLSTTLTAGRHYYRIEYSGDANYAARTVDESLLVLQPNTFWDIDARGTAAGMKVVHSGYWVYRATGLGPITPCCQYTGSSDPTAEPGVVYVYFSSNTRVNGDVGQRVSFTDDPLLPGQKIRAVHLSEIVAAANKVRTAANLGPIALGNPIVVTAEHVNALRTAINEARTALGAYAVNFTDTIGPGGVIRAVHFQELREAVR